MARRITFREDVDGITVQVAQGQRWTESARVQTLGPEDRPGNDGAGKIQIIFGYGTEADAPWYGEEPTFTLSVAKAVELRKILDQAIGQATAPSN
ncbi:hypothetical protein [Mycobacterium talmoniae]|uniref:Uncharacterized protein n=1 Tax=Mycobacterium talmoniae TaxID=1858794 RepID=A0A1S1NCY0_9MYCO|nr:hypothetical protein [Mycobacterium talmoniae]OHV03525.1 hypothetical protein BKN37_14475 [Mycobacterium talmoniae]